MKDSRKFRKSLRADTHAWRFSKVSLSERLQMMSQDEINAFIFTMVNNAISGLPFKIESSEVYVISGERFDVLYGCQILFPDDFMRSVGQIKEEYEWLRVNKNLPNPIYTLDDYFDSSVEILIQNILDHRRYKVSSSARRLALSARLFPNRRSYYEYCLSVVKHRLDNLLAKREALARSKAPRHMIINLENLIRIDINLYKHLEILT